MSGPINPHIVQPAAGLHRLQAYWFVSVCRAVYFRDVSRGQALHNLIGPAIGIRVQVPGLLVPAAEVWRYGGAFAVVVIEGTTEWQQYIVQASGSPLVTGPIWPGRVGTFWALASLLLYPDLVQVLEQLGLQLCSVCGHSMGGALAQLLAHALDARPGIDVAGVYTLASPRVGDGTYAAGNALPQVRLTQRGDPVPLLPPSLNQPLDLTLLDLFPMPPTSYRHWGTRYHLDVDGAVYLPDEQSTWTEAGLALQVVVSGDQSWYTGHSSEEYARRLRLGIPQTLGQPHPDYPGVEIIDQWWAEVLNRPLPNVWPEFPVCPV